MKISDKGLALIKYFEGLRLKAYVCAGGLWTVGYGSTFIEGRRVKLDDVITESEAEKALQEHLEYEIYPVLVALVHVPLTQNQFDALCSFIYNLGKGAFESSTLLRKLNRHDYTGAAREFKRWVYAGGKKLEGLIRRRSAEEHLFLLTI